MQPFRIFKEDDGYRIFLSGHVPESVQGDFFKEIIPIDATPYDAKMQPLGIPAKLFLYANIKGQELAVQACSVSSFSWHLNKLLERIGAEAIHDLYDLVYYDVKDEMGPGDIFLMGEHGTFIPTTRHGLEDERHVTAATWLENEDFGEAVYAGVTGWESDGFDHLTCKVFFEREGQDSVAMSYGIRFVPGSTVVRDSEFEIPSSALEDSPSPG